MAVKKIATTLSPTTPLKIQDATIIAIGGKKSARKVKKVIAFEAEGQ